MSMIELKNVSKKYGEHIVLDNFNLTIHQGDFVSIMGKSGSGKSTILNIIGLLDKPTKGKVIINGRENPDISSAEGIKILRNEISYLFQNYGLVEHWSVKKNLKVSTKFLKLSAAEEDKCITSALSIVGLSEKNNAKIYELSGGEQQRVALAKCIIKPCKIILADEPTGSIDPKNRDIILEILKKINRKGKTVIIVTHDPKVEECALSRITL